MSPPAPNPPRLATVGEAALPRRLRAAKSPVALLFRTRGCAACQAMAAGLVRLAAEYAGQFELLSVDVERAPLLAEQYGVAAVPALLVLHDGEELTRVPGFATEALLRLLFAQLLSDELAPGMLWSPTEQAFEDAVIIPLLEAWGWPYRRQVVCPPPTGRAAVRGRVDILVYNAASGAPLTLFEAKRQIGTTAALQQACAQAREYALAFGLASFAVAAPAGLWIYTLDNGRARLLQACSGLEVATQPQAVKHALARCAG